MHSANCQIPIEMWDICSVCGCGIVVHQGDYIPTRTVSDQLWLDVNENFCVIRDGGTHVHVPMLPQYEPCDDSYPMDREEIMK